METNIKEVTDKIEVSKIPISELYSEIELTEDEIEEALFNARYTKAAAIKSAEYREQIVAPQKVIKYTSAQLLAFLEETAGFVVDEDNRAIADALCKYFAQDPEFEKLNPGYKLSKGILLFGGVGVGKTLLMQLFRNNQKQSYQVVACQDVEATYAKNGPDFNPQTGDVGLKRYFGLTSTPTKNQYGHNTLGFLFDDLGQEIASTKYFGTERNVMEEVLSQRYKNGLFDATHITTNLTGDQIETAYGLRVRDRMREMFNQLSFPGKAKSRR